MNEISFFCANQDFAVKQHDETNHEFRSCFERDRDRILYSKEFRRLNRKTQVFVSGFDDHIRNRLTHTIEVAQISQTIANHLGLNEALTMAIAYGHDVGHTPFGHVGERTLNYFMNGCMKFRDFSEVEETKKGFKHNLQALRVLTELEQMSNDFNGLNLTNFTLWGIVNHTGIKPKMCEYKTDVDCDSKCLCHMDHGMVNCNNSLCFDFYDAYFPFIDQKSSWTVEGLIVRIADEIAQRHHDIEDGLFAGLIDREEIIQKLEKFFVDFFNDNEKNKLDKLKKERRLSIFIHILSSLIVNFLIRNLIDQTKINLEKIKGNYMLNDSNDFHDAKIKINNEIDIFNIVKYSDKLQNNEEKLQKFLKNRILNSHIAQSMDGKSTFILRKLIHAYLDNPQQLPDNTISLLYKRLWNNELEVMLGDQTEKEKIGSLRESLRLDHSKLNLQNYRTELMRTICDFIAGMTDDYAIMLYNKLYGTANVFSNY